MGCACVKLLQEKFSSVTTFPTIFFLFFCSSTVRGEILHCRGARPSACVGTAPGRSSGEHQGCVDFLCVDTLRPHSAPFRQEHSNTGKKTQRKGDRCSDSFTSAKTTNQQQFCQLMNYRFYCFSDRLKQNSNEKGQASHAPSGKSAAGPVACEGKSPISGQRLQSTFQAFGDGRRTKKRREGLRL